jgi:thiosulfate dehydrogenase
MNRNILSLLLLVLTPVAVLRGQGVRQTVRASGEAAHKQVLAQPPSSLPIMRTWTPPDASKIPSGQDGEAILLGMRIFMQTPKYASAYVGNQLSCGDCHVQGGTMSHAIALVGVPNWFPMFSDRAKRDISLEDRIQECVTRSESGSPLPHGGPEINALVAYFQWISKPRPGKESPARGLASIPALTGDPARGETIYKETCSTCHGQDGAGVPGILPALWGPNAFNQGAGMNQPKKMAAFVLHNMPQNNPGTLTPQQAYDVATYIASKPHSPYNHAYDIY